VIPDAWPRFPCAPDKRPLTEHGLHDATTDTAIIAAWRARWPAALVGVPTGQAIGAVVLDVDIKRPEANGYDTLDDLGFGILPNTPMVHTSSGGLHLYLALPVEPIRNTQGSRGRGIGPGLDWRGEGGYVIVPSPGGGYSWDLHWNLGTVPLAEVPEALLPREPARVEVVEPAVKPTTGLSPYAEAALDSACRRIISAPAGEQEATLNGEAFAIGTLAGAGAVPADFARRALAWAALRIPNHDPRRPWRPREIEIKVARAFNEGLRHPRAVSHV
jgi:hypothetical protein